MQDINIPFGLCQFKYGDIELIQGEEAIFSAIPEYEEVRGGTLAHIQNYLVHDYKVSFEVNVDKENYDILKLNFPILKDYQDGLIDDIANINTNGKRLIIHPVGAVSNDLDITMFDAHIEPSGLTRTFAKQTDSLLIRFVGKPVQVNKQFKNSYFYIGDLSKLEGVNL